MVRRFGIILLLIIVSSYPISADAVPQILTDLTTVEVSNKEYLITWTVLDDNLMLYEIRGNGIVLKNGTFPPASNLTNYTISFQTSIGNGVYTFTLFVTDYDNHTASDSLSITVGKPPAQVLDLDFDPFFLFTFFAIIPVYARKIRCYNE